MIALQAKLYFIIIISVSVNILYVCYRFIYFNIIFFCCFKIGEVYMLVVAMSYEDRARTAENLSAEAFELRRIASERHRFRRKTIQNLETSRSISPESRHLHIFLPVSHFLRHNIRTILSLRPTKTELCFRTAIFFITLQTISSDSKVVRK